MCELLVRIIRKDTTGDQKEDAKLSQPGDVISVQEDGWNWGTKELKSDIWQIIKVPGVRAALASDYLRQDIDLATGELLRWRSVGLNTAFVDQLKADKVEAQKIDADHISIATALDINQAREDKPVSDVGVIG